MPRKKSDEEIREDNEFRKRLEAKLRVMRCSLSLARAVNDAGGVLNDIILKMPVEEFIVGIASNNNIFFMWKDPNDVQT